MARIPSWALFVALALSLSAGAMPGTALAADSPRVIYNLATRQNDKEIIALIDAAKTRIYFAMYTFTLPDIADALVAAKQRGVEVRGLLDAHESTRSSEAPIVEKLRRAGIPLETARHADAEALMHIKAMVTDSAYAVGSYNWSRLGTTENDEILEIGTDPATVAAYQRILKGLLDQYAENPVAPQSVAARPAVVYDYTEAPAHIGERASVRGRIIDVHTTSHGTVFDFCANYRTCPFSGVIFADDERKFGDLSRYSGKTVALTGIISSYRGRAEIKLSDPSQLASIN